MFQYDFIKTVDEDSGISYVSADFAVNEIVYMAIFSDDKDTLSYLEEYDEITSLIQNKQTYSVKFAVKEYIETGNDDLYAPPLNHGFGRAEIQILKQHLESLLFEHYTLFKPDCYLFIADRPSLARMYRKMCCNPSQLMANFRPVIDLGENKDCFIIKTPTY